MSPAARLFVEHARAVAHSMAGEKVGKDRSSGNARRR
jgi:hypothetical protein